MKLPSGVFGGPEGKTAVAEKRTGSFRKNKVPAGKRDAFREEKVPSGELEFLQENGGSFIIVRIPSGKIKFLQEKQRGSDHDQNGRSKDGKGINSFRRIRAPSGKTLFILRKTNSFRKYYRSLRNNSWYFQEKLPLGKKLFSFRSPEGKITVENLNDN